MEAPSNMYQHPMLPGGKHVSCVNCIVCTNSSGVASHSYQGMAGTLPKSKFPGAGQVLTLQTDHVKIADSGLHANCFMSSSALRWAPNSFSTSRSVDQVIDRSLNKTSDDLSWPHMQSWVWWKELGFAVKGIWTQILIDHQPALRYFSSYLDWVSVFHL